MAERLTRWGRTDLAGGKEIHFCGAGRAAHLARRAATSTASRSSHGARRRLRRRSGGHGARLGAEKTPSRGAGRAFLLPDHFSLRHKATRLNHARSPEADRKPSRPSSGPDGARCFCRCPSVTHFILLVLACTQGHDRWGKIWSLRKPLSKLPAASRNFSFQPNSISARAIPGYLTPCLLQQINSSS